MTRQLVNNVLGVFGNEQVHRGERTTLIRSSLFSNRPHGPAFFFFLLDGTTWVNEFFFLCVPMVSSWKKFSQSCASTLCATKSQCVCTYSKRRWCASAMHESTRNSWAPMLSLIGLAHVTADRSGSLVLVSEWGGGRRRRRWRRRPSHIGVFAIYHIVFRLQKTRRIGQIHGFHNFWGEPCQQDWQLQLIGLELNVDTAFAAVHAIRILLPTCKRKRVVVLQ